MLVPLIPGVNVGVKRNPDRYSFLRYNIEVGLRAFVPEKQAAQEGGDKMRCIWAEILF
jgi:hypothetical protein